jgi:hypothetical protein
VWRDPAHLFDGGRYEEAVARLLLEGRHVSGVSDYDERRVQAHVVAGLDAPPDVLAVGSSRLMQLRREQFPGARFFNAAVSGASGEDLAAIYELYRSRGLLPRRLVVGLDPWVLNRNHGQTRWRTLAASYAAFAAREGLRAPSELPSAHGGRPRLLEALAPAYFQASLRSLLAGPGRRAAVRATDDPEAEEAAAKRSDGSHVYGRAFRERPPGEVGGDAASYARATPPYSLGSFTELDAEARRIVEALVRRARADGVEPTLVLAPYHPDAYRILVGAGRYPIIRAAEAWFRELAGAEQVPVVGSFDPVAAGVPAELFFDGMHPKEEVFRRLLQGVPPAPAGVAARSAEAGPR